MASILGILNVTRDSFSDGGRYFDPDAAVGHARRLLADGADAIDIGAESSHPDAEDVPADEEVSRLTPVVTELKRHGAAVSVDTFKPSVMSAMVRLGADIINDITALESQASRRILRDSNARVILMHARHARPGGTNASTRRSAHLYARAERIADAPSNLPAAILEFFSRRIAELVASGIARERLILDPGMGLFLGTSPQASLSVLKHLRELMALGCPICVSTSRKSFIGAVLADQSGPRPIAERVAGTLATELWAVAQGAAWIRTHEPRPLRDALRLQEAIAAAP